MNALIAQAGLGFGAYSFTQIMVFIIIVAACVGIMYVALRVFGVAIPSWVVQIFWIVVVAFVAIAAIRFVTSM